MAERKSAFILMLAGWGLVGVVLGIAGLTTGLRRWDRMKRARPRSGD
jgi:hypothetical protein